MKRSENFNFFSPWWHKNWTFIDCECENSSAFFIQSIELKNWDFLKKVGVEIAQSICTKLNSVAIFFFFLLARNSIVHSLAFNLGAFSTLALVARFPRSFVWFPVKSRSYLLGADFSILLFDLKNVPILMKYICLKHKMFDDSW